MKKLLSLVLVLCMVFGMSVSVFAASPIANDEELAEAIAAGETNLTLGEGTFHMPAAAKGKTLTITGAGASTIIEVVPGGQGEANGQLDYSLDGSTVTFNDLTIKTNSQLYAGYARLSATYNNCVIQNTYNLGVGDSEFNNCTFNITNEYLRVGGANSATFNNCTFNTDGRAILVFQDGTNVHQVVTVKDCTFNATAAAYTWNGIHVAAVSIDGTKGTYTVNIEGTNTVDANFNGISQVKAGENNVTVEVKEPTPPTPEEPEIPVAKEETYKSVVSASIENGSVKVDSKKATRGEKVTIIVTPDKGYELAALSVIDEDGNERKVTENEDGTFSFRMPEGGVTIEAEFAKIGASTSAPSTEKENPSTGASDFVGAAAALAVVSVMGMAALSIKR